MVLLTSSQVQVALTSTIIVSFTFFLFLAGYITQQRTVAGIQQALKPQAPLPRHKLPEPELPTPDPPKRLSRPLGRLRDRVQWQKQLTSAEKPFDWSRFAYAQLVRDHSELCNALIIFSDLHKLKSPTPRLLLFPQHWMKETDGEVLNPFLETSRRLLKKASRRYRVVLVPIWPADKMHENNPEAYSMARLFSLHQYERVLSFPPPALVLDSTALDSILAFSETETVAAYPPLNASEPSVILISPSKSNEKAFGHQALSSLKSEELLPFAEDHSLFTTSQTLRTIPPKEFNAAKFLAATAFIHFADPDLPGPEFDVPYSKIVKMRPEGDDQGFLWEKMYSTYKDRRYGVCGLDLEVWPPIAALTSEENKDAAVSDVERKQDL